MSEDQYDLIADRFDRAKRGDCIIPGVAWLLKAYFNVSPLALLLHSRSRVGELVDRDDLGKSATCNRTVHIGLSDFSRSLTRSLARLLA